MSLFPKLLLVSLGGALVWLSVHVFTSRDEPYVVAHSQADSRTAAPDGYTAAAPPTPQSAPEPGPIQHDSSNSFFRIDAAGEPIVDHDTIHRLGHLIEQLPAQHTPADMRRIEDLVTEGLPGQASANALRILHDFINYSREEATLLAHLPDEDAGGAAQTLKRVAALRRRHFAPHIADALFGRQEMEARFSIDVMQIETDASLSAEEKAVRIATLQRAVQAELYSREAESGATRITQAGSEKADPSANGPSAGIVLRSPF